MPFFHENHKPGPVECYEILIDLLHGKNFRCPNGHEMKYCVVHKANRKPLITYKCKACKKIFSIFTTTPIQGTRYNLVQIALILDRLSRGYTAEEIAMEQRIDLTGLKRNLPKLQVLLEKADKIERPPKGITGMLSDIESWEIVSDPEDPKENILILKFKLGKYYLLRRGIYSNIDPKREKKRVVQCTEVMAKSPQEFKKFRESLGLD